MKCNFCGNENFKHILTVSVIDRSRFDKNNLMDKTKENLDIYCCMTCGYGVAGKQYSEEELDAMYKSYEYTSPFENLSVSSWFNRNIELIEKYLSKDSFIVEIGSSEGYFLHLLNINGYTNNLGIEPSEHAELGISRNLNIKRSFFTQHLIEKERLFNKNTVDAFVMLHTFEHFANPFEIFADIAEGGYLKENGLVFIETPNFSSFNIGHISFFSWPFYERMARKYGMKIIEVIDGQENISVVFAKIDSEYPEIKCPYDMDYVIQKVKNTQENTNLYYLEKINEIRDLLKKNKSMIIWGTKNMAGNIINDIPDICNYGCKIIPVDSYASRKGYILQNIIEPTVNPDDIKNMHFDTIIITTEYVSEVIKTIKQYNITFDKIIQMVISENNMI